MGISYEGSWHAKYKSSYVFVGNLDYELTEGDLIMVMSQFGEVVDCNLVRDKDTGKPMGFCFLAYEGLHLVLLTTIYLPPVFRPCFDHHPIILFFCLPPQTARAPFWPWIT